MTGELVELNVRTREGIDPKSFPKLIRMAVWPTYPALTSSGITG